MIAKLEVKIDPNGPLGLGRFLPREIGASVNEFFNLNHLTTEVDQMVERALELLVSLYAQGLNRLPSNFQPEEFEGVRTLCDLLSAWAPILKRTKPVLFISCKHSLEFARDMNLADKDFQYHPWVKSDIEMVIERHFS